MNITFLGGGSEIGASSALVEVGETRLLVDCGMRMSGDSRLPDFGLLPAGGEVAGVILTHAHMDHSGALPVFHQHFPHVPVYATAPTCALDFPASSSMTKRRPTSATSASSSWVRP